jgi:hypothetical protein
MVAVFEFARYVLTIPTVSPLILGSSQLVVRVGPNCRVRGFTKAETQVGDLAVVLAATSPPRTRPP